MARKAVVELIGDAASLKRAAAESVQATNAVAGGLKRLGVDAQASANTQIQASLRKDSRLRAEIVSYREVAAAAEKGSREQIVASNLAERAQARLSRSMGVTAAESLRLSSSSRSAERDIGRATRGALAGSGVFHGLGRSLAFASGGFLAFASGGQLIRTSIDAAREAEVTQRQLGAQLAVSGKSLEEYRGQIDKTTLRLSALSGFTKQDLDKAFITILRTTGNVSKSLRDVGTAAALSRAKPNLGLAQSATIIAKVEAGNTTLLRRQGFEISKTATKTEALAAVRKALAGQLAAGTTEEQKFAAILHDSEVIIGEGLLPTVNKYLLSGSKWLQQMNESGKLQKDVKQATSDLTGVVHVAADGFKIVAGAVKVADKVTGSFEHTLELIAALKLASWAAGIGRNLGLIGGEAKTASAEVGILRGKLATLTSIGAIVVTIDIVERLIPKKVTSGGQKILNQEGGGAFGKLPIIGPVLESGAFAGRKVGNALGIHYGKPPAGIPKEFTGSTATMEAFLAGKEGEAAPFSLGARDGGSLLTAYLAGRKAAGLTFKKAAKAETDAQTKPPPGSSLTVQQRNSFFDSSISRILLRGGLGNLQQQLAATEKASGLLTRRLAATKDITRKLNLEDQILQLASQGKDLRQQIAAQSLQARQDSFSNLVSSLQLGVTKAQATGSFRKDIEALQALQDGLRAEVKSLGTSADLQGQLFDVGQQIKQAKQQHVSAKEFFTLGLGPSGEDRVPLAGNLRKRLGTLSQAVSGTFLDTTKTRSELSKIRKVLSESIVPTDVRSKIKDLLDGVRSDLNNGLDLNKTKFAHESSLAFVNSIGAGLNRDQKRAIEAAFAQVGPGGTVPGKGSAAFASAGTTVHHTVLDIDGKTVATVVTKHQRKKGTQRTSSRRGPYAGRT